MDFAVLNDYRVKIKENEKIDKYFDFAEGLKKMGNMKGTVIGIAVNALGTVHKDLEKNTGRTGNQGKTRDHTDKAVLILARILKIDSLKTEKEKHSNQNERQSNNNRNTTHPCHSEQTLTQEEEMIIENLKRIMSEKKTRLPLLRNQDWKMIKAETEK